MHIGKTLLLTIIALIIIVFVIITCVLNSDSYKRRLAANQPDTLENWTITTIPAGGSLYSVLGKSELPMQEIGLFAIRFGEQIDVTTIQPGDTLKYKLTEDNSKIERLIYIQEIDEQHHFRLRGDTLVYNLVKLPTTKAMRLINGTLDTTLDNSLLQMGLTNSEKQQINNGLEGEVNFRKDARQGDSFQVLIEERFYQNTRLPKAKIYYVSYSGKLTGKHELFRYEENDEKSVLNGLYNKEGKSTNTSGVGFPLSRIHTISSFGRRIDPVYGGWRMHQGVDYLARHGTPVYAVSHGSVISAGWNGGYGKCVTIKHPSGYSTLYAHLSSIGVKNGQTVKRGHIIGRVGSTGKSTGAHLHFGLIQNKKYINPNNLRMVGAEKLNPSQMERFKKQMEQIRQILAQQPIS